MRSGAVAVAGVAVALVAGGVFFGVGGTSGDSPSAASVPIATLPPVTVAPPAPAMVGDDAVEAVSSIDDTGTLPVPNVIGVSQTVAESRLSDFEVEVVTATATDADFFDAVSAQQPGPSERLPAGGTVTITLSVQPTPETIPADPLPLGTPVSVDLVDMRDGDCGNGSLVDDQLVYEPVDCDEFHDAQLISRFAVEGAPDDFDRLALDDLLLDQCAERFEEFVGVELGDSRLSLQTVRPDEQTYVSEGDRMSLCFLLGDTEVRIQGSAEGSLW